MKVQNHSARFWAEVERMLPDYKLQREWLKKNGHTLSLDGAA
ncbi:MAG: M48 family metallopeptidase [Chloroflexi bacterium]|nr:M48 family metallopeptidase [Chloroflexota bacterium]